MTEQGTIAERLAAAEVTAPRPLAGLLERLRLTGRTPVAVGPAGSFDPDRAAAMISGLTADSRTVTPGALFVAIPGAHDNGHAHAADAIRSGATALLVEHPISGLTVPQIMVDRTRPALAEAAAWWYGDPSRELGVVGITGTDGKTTTSFLVSAALAGAGVRAGLIGTVATEIGGRREANPDHATTPEAPALQRALRAMVRAGDRVAIIETTSHGLAMDRVTGIDYDVAIFTNLTHEHLELHGSFEAYRTTKLMLFERLAIGPRNPSKPRIGWPRTGIVNADDPAAPVFAGATRAAGARLITYGADASADVRLVGAGEDASGLTVRYEAPSGAGTVVLRLAGRFNAWNALAALALGEALGLEPGAVRAGMEEMPGVPGRMARIDAGQPFDVVVDYAHSPASLQLVLDELVVRAAARGGGVIAVFGSAGERDTGKRPLMGRIAAERCRLVVLTDEDPRGEDPGAILREIAAGAQAGSGPDLEAVLEIPDRATAIREAFHSARPGDVVLLAGKGHETTILGAAGALPWDERAEAIAALRELGWTQ